MFRQVKALIQSDNHENNSTAPAIDKLDNNGWSFWRESLNK